MQRIYDSGFGSFGWITRLGTFLGSGIGANTAIFELIDTVRLRALPAANPLELAYLDYAPHSTRGGWLRSSIFPQVIPVRKVIHFDW
jgi:hypothetical protein